MQASRAMRDSGATLYLCNLKPSVHAALERGGFLDEFGRDRVWPTKADAIRALYKRFARAAVRTAAPRGSSPSATSACRTGCRASCAATLT